MRQQLIDEFIDCIRNANDKVIVIGVCGATRSGKTTLASFLFSLLSHHLASPPQHDNQTTEYIIKLIHQDYYSKKEKPLHSSGVTNYDCPDSFHNDQMLHDMQEFSRGTDNYFVNDHEWANKSLSEICHITDHSSNNNDVIMKKRILIVEGILIYSGLPQIQQLYNLKFFVHVDKDLCKRRRMTTYHSLHGSEEYFDNVVWPCYELYNQHILQRRNGDSEYIHLDGSQDKPTVQEQAIREAIVKLKQCSNK